MNNLKFRRVISWIITFTMLISMMPSVFAADKTVFVDFPDGWSREAVGAAVDNGLLQGRTPTTLEPQGNLTRAEMATVINRAFGAKIEADISTFYDVNITEWYYHEIAKAVNMQTFYGDGNGRMRPNDFITREEIFAVIARALVLETDDYSSLSKFGDESEVSSWALPYASILVQKGYVNGNDMGMLCPKDNITREEFAQIMHNIIKTYFTEEGTYETTGPDCTLIRESGAVLKNMTVEGDLILGDGVGNGTVILENVTIKGRLLCRGGEGSVKLTNTTVGEMVVVKDVNGTVNFHNYRDEAPFKGIVEITPATFLKRASTGTSRPSGGSSGGSSSKYHDVVVDGAHFDNEEYSVKDNNTFTVPDVDKTEYPGFAGWISDDNKLYKPGDEVVITDDMKFYAVYYYTVHHFFQKSDLSDNYVEDEALLEKAYAKEGEVISAKKSDKSYYICNVEKSTASVTVSATKENVIKLYYDRQSAKLTFDLNGATAPDFDTVVYTAVGEKYKLPEADTLSNPGFYFDGWQTEGGAKYPEGYEYPVNSTTPITFKAVWDIVPPASKASYRMEYWLLKAGGTNGVLSDYECVDVKVYNETVGEIVTIDAKLYPGFEKTNVQGLSVESGEVIADGSLVLKIYYDRVNVTVSYNTDGGTLIADTSVQYGNILTLPGGNSTTKDGYILVGWKIDGTTYVPGSAIVIESLVPVTANAVWEEAPVPTANYTVKYYRLDKDCAAGVESSYVLTDTVTLTGHVGKTVFATEKTFYGFEKATIAGLSVESGEVKADGTLELKVFYNRKNVVASFNTDGGTPSVDDINVGYGNTLTLPNAVAKTGYTFKGWKDATGIVYPAGYHMTVNTIDNIAFTAEWEEIPAEITYYTVEHWHLNKDGVPGNSTDYTKYETEKIENTAAGTLVSAEAKTYYGFAKSTVIASEESGTVLPGGALALKIYYDRVKVSVTFDTKGGAPSIDEMSVGYGCDFTLPALGSTTQTGKTLTGWKNADGVIYPLGATVTVTSTNVLAFEAVWEDVVTPPAHTSSYKTEHWLLKLGGINGNASDYECVERIIYNNVEVGTSVSLSENVYEGFEETKVAGLTVKSGEVKADGSLVLKIYYDRVDVTVSYNTDGGTAIADTTVQYGNTLTLPGKNSTTKDGYVLVGWEVGGTTYVPGSVIVVESLVPVTAKAVWEAAPVPTANYVVQHYLLEKDLGAGVESSYRLVDTVTLTGLVGETVTAAEKTFYGFEKATIAGVSVESGNVKADGSLELKVFYNRKNVVASFNTDGGTPSVDDINVGYGNTLALPNAVAKTGYTFKGWKDATGIVYPAGYQMTVNTVDNMTFTAEWEAIPAEYSNYKVEYYHLNADADAADIENYTCIETKVFYNAEVGTSVSADIKSYDGFKQTNAVASTVTGTVQANNGLVLKVYYDRITIDVTYNTNGGTPAIAPAEVCYGCTLVLPDITSTAISGKTLKGWADPNGVIYPAGSAVKVNYLTAVQFTAVWEDAVVPPATTASYKAVYYQLKAGGTSGVESDYIIGETETYYNVNVGEAVNAEPKVYYGFEKVTIPGLTLESATVASDNSTVLRIYYDRVNVSVVYNEDGGTDIADTSVQYGSTLTLPGENSTTKDGYILVGWEVDGTAYVPGSTIIIDGITLVNVKAIWNSAPIPSTYYTVEYYQLKANTASGVESNYQLVETVTVVDVLVGSDATAPAKTYEGFTKSTEIASVESGTVLENGALVLKVYYDRNILSVKYRENGGTPDMADTTVGFGNTLVLPSEADISRTGYIFLGWQDADGVIYPGGYEFVAYKSQDYVFTAYWTENIIPPVPTSGYKVEYYHQKPDTEAGIEANYTCVETVAFYDVEIGKAVTAEIKTYDGFVQSTSIASVTTGNVADHNALVLKVYYDRITIAVSFDTVGGNPQIPATTVGYGCTLKLPDSTSTAIEGKHLIGWKDASGITYPAGSSITVTSLVPVEFVAVWEDDAVPPVSTASYKVEHYQLKVGGTNGTAADYECIETEIFNGVVVGSDVSATVKTYTGFEQSTVIESVMTGNVLADGSLVLKIYYDRKSVSVTFDTDGGSTIPGTTAQYGNTLALPNENSTNKADYILVGWEVAGTTYKPGTDIVVNTESPIVIKAIWGTTPITYASYTVEHYQLDVGKATYTLIESDVIKDVAVGTEASATAKDYTGFTFNAGISTMSGVVKEDGSLVLKVYYDRVMVAVSYDEDGGSDIPGTSVQFGATLTLPGDGSTSKQGYILEGWKDENGIIYPTGYEYVVNKTDSLVFTAVWEEIPAETSSYIVKHYQLKVGGTNGVIADYECIETETFNGVVVGTDVSATEKDYTGFITNTGISTISGEVKDDGSLVLEVYYDRVMVAVSYNEDGGSEIPDTSVQFGASLVLPGEGSTTKDGFLIAGWEYDGTTYNLSDTYVVNTESAIVFNAVWRDKDSVAYEIQYYTESLAGVFELYKSDSTNYAKVDDVVNIDTNNLEEIVGFVFDDANTYNVLSVTVTASGAVLKVYYKRVFVDISFDLDSGTALDDTTNAYSVKYGSTITLPLATCAENGLYILDGWKIGDNEYLPGEDVVITGSDEEWIFIAVWSEAELYEVIFYDGWGDPCEEYDVYENDKVEKEKFPDDELESAIGYEKNSYISPTLYSGENEYTHWIKKNWYYNVPGTTQWLRFTPDVPVTSDIVVDGKLHVRQRAPYLSLDFDLDERLLSERLIFSTFYEGTERDASGNVVAGTRFADTVKDLLWESLNTQYGETLFQTEVNKKLDLIIGKVRDKGLLGEDNSILPLNFFIRFAQVIGEDKLEKYIIDNAKESLSDNDELTKYVFDYFESVAKHGSDEDKKELEGLLEETIKGALEGEDSDEIMSLIEELCITMLDSPDMIEDAIKNVTGIEIDVTEADLGSNAKETVLGWAELLISDSMLDDVLEAIPYNNGLYTSENIDGVTTKDFIINIMKNADISLDDLENEGISHDDLFAAIKDALIKMILDKLETDETFFNKSVGHVFKGTPFETFKRDKVAEDTIDFFREVLTVYFESMTIEELAAELGYAEGVTDEEAINKFFNEHKQQVIKAILYELDNDPAFFEHVITKTEFAGLVTYDEVTDHDNSVKDLMLLVIERKLNAMDGEELLAEDVVKSLIEDFDSIKKALLGELSNDDGFFNEVMANAFAGTDLKDYDLSNIPEKTVDFVSEIIESKFNGMSNEDLAKLAGYDSVEDLLAYAKSEITDKIIENLTKNTDDAYTDLVKEFTGIEPAEFDALGTKEAFKLILEKYVEDAQQSGDYKELKKIIGADSSSWNDDKWNYFFANLELLLDDDSVLETYMLNISYGKYTFDESSVDRGEYPDATGIPSESKDFIIGLVDLRLENELDETLEEFGYNEQTIVEEAKEYAKDIVLDSLESDETYLKEQIAEIAGVTLAEVKENSRDLIIDIVDAKIGSTGPVNDEFAQKFGFDSLEALLDNESVKSILVEKAVNKAENDDTFLKDQIKEYTGIENQDVNAEAHVLFDLIVEKRITDVNGIDDALAESLGYTTADELLEAAKPGVIEVIIDDLGNDVENYRPYIIGYIGEDFGEIPVKSMDFITKYAKNVLESMTEAEIREELALMGFNDDDIDHIIEAEIEKLISNPDDELLLALVKMVSKKYAGIASLDELPALAEEFVTEEASYRLESDDAYLKEILESKFGYVPDSFFTDATYTTKQFLVDVVIHMFEHDVTKRDAIIDQAVKELVEKGDFSQLEDYVDYAVDYLKFKTYPDGTTEFDRVVDEIIELRYRETLDKLVDQLINEDKFEIEASTSFILPAFEMQVKAYSFDELIAGVPEAVFKVYPREKLEEIYNEAYNNLISQIEEGKAANENGETAVIDTGLKFNIDLVDDIYAPLRDRFVEIVANSKAGENFYYAENPYLQELIKLTEVDELFDANSDGTGYKFKEYNDYYDLVLKLAIIGDDAVVWYTEELTPDEIDSVVLSYENLVLKYVNAVADILEGYAKDETLPDKLEGNNAINAVESAIKDRFPELVDKALDWYLSSPFNKDYTSEDYEKGRKAIRKVIEKVYASIDVTTDEVFELPYKIITEVVDIAEGKITPDNINKVASRFENLVKINGNQYTATLKGKTVIITVNNGVYTAEIAGKVVTINTTGEGVYTVDINGKSVKLQMTKDDYIFTAGENVIAVNRSIQ